MLEDNTLERESYFQNISPAKGIITVKEAKKLLGQKSKNLSDEELKILIRDTEAVVRIAVRNFIGSKNLKNHDRIPSGLEIS